jgi:hypothetical protein
MKLACLLFRHDWASSDEVTPDEVAILREKGFGFFAIQMQALSDFLEQCTRCGKRRLSSDPEVIRRLYTAFDLKRDRSV